MEKRNFIHYNLKINIDVWEKFKETINKNDTINKILIDLILKRINNQQK